MIKHVIRYLINTEYRDIILPTRNDVVQIFFLTDLYCGRDLSNRISHTGILDTINGALVIWTYKLQTWTATSTSEANLNPLAYSVKELKWIRPVFSEFDAIDSEPIEIKQDNIGFISSNQLTNILRNYKHVGIKYYCVHDAIESKNVQIACTKLSENRYDSLINVMIGEEFAKYYTWLCTYM